MNILPVNIDPMIRAYPHHLFPHSIMSKNYSAGNLLADVDIMRIKDNTFITIERNAKFKITDGNYMLYSDLYAPQADNIIYRLCDKNDEIIVKINHQHYSRNWASIHLFIDNLSDLECKKNLKTCDVRFGKCCRDSLFVYDGKNKFFPYYKVSEFPYWLRIKVKDNEVLAYISDDGINWVEKLHCYIPFADKTQRVIGVCFDLQADSYYDWLFSNYIQLFSNLEHQLLIDFLVSPYKNYLPYSHNPILDFLPIRKEIIESKYDSIFEYIKSCIDIKKYIDLYLDEFFMPDREAYGEYHIRVQNLVYGYDNDSIYLLGLDSGKPIQSKISIKDFFNAYETCKEMFNFVYEIDFFKCKFSFKLDYFKRSLENYMSGEIENPQLYNMDSIMPLSDVTFGMNIYSKLLTDKGIEIIKNDNRVAYVIKEHKTCMYERLKFLKARGFLNECNYEILIGYATELKDKSSTMLNLIIKNEIKNDSLIAEKLKNHLIAIKAIEEKYYPLLLELLQ